MRTKKRFRNKGRSHGSEASGLRVSIVDGSKLSIVKEIDSIIKSAENGEGRVVAIAKLLLFSVDNGDAWILDVEDGLALQLAADYETLEFKVTEDGSQFAIQWTSVFEMDDGVFYAVYPNGKISAHYDYPVDLIHEMIESILQQTQAPH